MKKNRLLAIVLAVLLLAGALGGCAASTKSAASAPMASYDTAAGGNYKSEIGANQAAETPAEAPVESEIAAAAFRPPSLTIRLQRWKRA